MAIVVGVLAACAGVILAAADSPHVRDKARLHRFSVLLIAGTAAAATAGAVVLVRQWIAA